MRGKMLKPMDLYIITTAAKRDKHEWEEELKRFGISDKPTAPTRIDIHVDSWNNIYKYRPVENAFFIFDEQRVIGNGTWVKAFYAITKKNQWVLLTATPGDTWLDYAPVMIANGYYKNITQFKREHVIYSAYTNFPKVDRYVNQGKLTKIRSEILVNMVPTKENKKVDIIVMTDYNRAAYKELIKSRWDYRKNEPIKNAAGLCYLMSQIVNTDPSRVEECKKILSKHKRVIIFYNYDYELDILKQTKWGNGVGLAEWNGHKHEPLPTNDSWVYLVQYTAGCEGWNCTECDCVIFYSLSYSWKKTHQAAGRIDRMNTKFEQLYYYHLKSASSIDITIAKALDNKKDFDKRKFAGHFMKG